jgi:hypothetical protein
VWLLGGKYAGFSCESGVNRIAQKTVQACSLAFTSPKPSLIGTLLQKTSEQNSPIKTLTKFTNSQIYKEIYRLC